MNNKVPSSFVQYNATFEVPGYTKQYCYIVKGHSSPHGSSEGFGWPIENCSAGISAGDKDQNGELELKLEVDGHEGSVFISKEVWMAIGEKAGWIRAEEENKQNVKNR